MKTLKLFKSKKGMFFLITAVLMTFVSLTYAFIMLQDKVDLDRQLGTTPAEIFMQYQDGDKVLFFIDEAAENSLRDASFDLMKTGGVGSSCNSYYGFSIWDESNNCLPDTPKIYSSLGSLFSQRMQKHLVVYPNITFLKYHVSNVPGISGSTSSSSTNTSSSAGGFVNIPPDDQIYCAGSVKKYDKCKLLPELIIPLKGIKQHLAPDERIIIVSALRSQKAQKWGYLNTYIKKGWPPVCGPNRYLRKIWTDIGPPPKQDYKKLKKNSAERTSAFEKYKLNSDAYKKKVDNYLSSHPEIQTALDTLDNYNHCKHVTGQAIDINFAKKKSNNKLEYLSQSRLREIMCKAGWVNFGKEDWHYEYLSSNWNKKRPDKIPDNLVGSPLTNNYHKNCYFGKLV